jgi:hypothetical protein
VLHVVSSPSLSDQRWISAVPRRKKVDLEIEKREDIFSEVLRLADVAFIAYEISPYGGMAYQQMLTDDHEPGHNPAQIQTKTVLGSPRARVSTERLPVCWCEPKSTYGGQIRGQTIPEKRAPVGDGSVIN